jgi:predicted PurR-regulated permease PerM
MDPASGGETEGGDIEVDGDQRELRFFHEVHVIRGAILMLALGMMVAILNYASVILVPIVLAVLFAYVLNPFVRALARLRLPGTELRMPRGVAAMFVVIVAVSMTISLGILIGEQLGSFVVDVARYENRIVDNIRDVQKDLLQYQDRLESFLEPLRGSPAGEGLEADENGSDGGESLAEFVGPQRSIIEQTSELWVRASSYIAGGLTGLLGFVAQALTCIFVLFFMLVEGATIRSKLINILGKTAQRRDKVVEVLENVNRDVQRYLFYRFTINSVLALVAMLAYWIYGLNYVLLLGILAGLFNFVPYVGPFVGAIFPALVAYIQFGTFESVFWVVFIYGALTAVEGNVITPILLGRHLQLNSLAVILGLVFWGWLWGAIGMLLAIPILAAIKAVSQNVDDLQPVAELLRA